MNRIRRISRLIAVLAVVAGSSLLVVRNRRVGTRQAPPVEPGSEPSGQSAGTAVADRSGED